jgi:glucuronoarabinoxylan endo-1,4-beta-xylanase
MMLIIAILSGGSGFAHAQDGIYESFSLIPAETHQVVTGFGASLAYYENWLTAHPKKAEIFDVIFAELSLDILRVRNAYGYDSTMIERVVEFADAAENSLGKPIPILSSSWGPPKYLKSNNDRKNGGTLKYTTDGNGVEFDYAGFARWWDESLDEYNSNGIYPAYISIQNEPDWAASWETCLFRPEETVTASDTIAGYNKALDAVYDTLIKREQMPRILGAEPAGIGYNSVHNYINALDVSKLYGICHHLYNGVDKNNPWSSTNFATVGNLYPEIPHFQTEFSGGDWFSLAGLIYKSFHDENTVAYLYWDLIWVEGGGLVSLEFPWNPSSWTDPQKGYARTKDFYAFKQFSRFIHPGWTRISTSPTDEFTKPLAFVNPDMDSAVCVVINRSTTDSLTVHLSIPGYTIDTSAIFITSDTENFKYNGQLMAYLMKMPPRSVSTVQMNISELPVDCNGDINGIAFIDSCGVCAEGNTGIIPILDENHCIVPVDCNGDTNGVAFIDSCGICAGGNTGITPILDKEDCMVEVDCNGDTNGIAFVDSCGICAGGNTGIIPVLVKEECPNQIDDLLPDASIFLSFNPVLDVLNVNLSGKNGVLHIFDISGKSLLLEQIENEISLDVSSLENGIYIVKVPYDNRIFTGKFVKY